MVRTNVHRLLEAAGIPFEPLEYDTGDGRIDARSVAAKIGRSPDEVFKTLVVRGAPRSCFVFIIPGSAELDLRKAARAAGCKHLEMLPQRELLPLTGYVHGGCSPIGMKHPLPAFLDETAILFDTICVSAGRVGSNLAIAPGALADFLRAPCIDLTV